MNRTDRLLAILLELQHKGRLRAEDLAETFETSKRTIYRDIQALSESGVPIVATPGSGYALMDGYFLPPVSFTADEGTLLLLGSDYAARLFDHQYQQSARAASQKIEAILSPALRERVQYLRNSLQLLSLDPSYRSAGRDEHWEERLQQVRTAILEGRRLELVYQKREIAGTVQPEERRQVDPFGCVNIHGVWHLIGHCHLREEIRQFRLDRICSLRVMPEKSSRPEDFSIVDYEPQQNRNCVVQVLFRPETARSARECRPYYWTAEQETEDGLEMTLHVRQEDDVLQWILGWGAQVKVLKPATLREKVRQQAEKMLDQY